MKGTVRFALGLAGMPEATINEIDKALPALGRLLVEIEPILVKIYPDVIAALPALRDIIAFAQKEDT